jgi:hypothetical protein
MRVAIVLITLGLAVVQGGIVQAQELEPPRARQGYYVGAGSFAAVGLAREKGTDYSFAGNGLSFHLGQLVTSRWSLGLTLGGGGGEGDGQKVSFGGLALETGFVVVRNVAVHGALGVGFLTLDDPKDDDEGTRGGGGAYFETGASWDFFPFRNRLTGGWALTPKIAFRILPVGSDGARSYTGLLGLQVLYWTGLPRNQLQLPESEGYR